MARRLLSRATKCVNDRLEKINIWKFWIILEHFYGVEKTLQKLFKESIRTCDSFAIYQLMIEIYKRQHKWKSVERAYHYTISKFPGKQKLWSDFYNLQKYILSQSKQYMTKIQQITLKAKLAEAEFSLKRNNLARRRFNFLL